MVCLPSIPEPAPQGTGVHSFNQQYMAQPENGLKERGRPEGRPRVRKLWKRI